MADKKTLFHSELATLGPVRVMVKEERKASKYSKPDAPKPDYVTLVIGGKERFYTCENEACAEFFADQRGRTFTLVAEGSREEATLTYVGEASQEQAPATAARPPVSRPPAAKPQGQRPPVAAPAQQRPPAAKPGVHVPMGQTVGMAVNNACHSLTAQGMQLEPQKVFEIASDILRVSYNLEKGKLAPMFAERNPPKPKAAPAPTSPANPEPAQPEDPEVAF